MCYTIGTVYKHYEVILDTADTELIEKHFQTDLIDGITTNPTLIMKSGRNPEEVYQQLIDMGIDDIVWKSLVTLMKCIWKGYDYPENLERMQQSKFLVLLQD